MKYFGNWLDYASVTSDCFGGEYDYEKKEPKSPVVPDDFPKDDEIIFAAYGTPSYEGYALIVFERNSKLYEINGSHCSCYGLNETMGGNEETSREALKIRNLDSYYEYGDDAIARFKELFG